MAGLCHLCPCGFLFDGIFIGATKGQEMVIVCLVLCVSFLVCSLAFRIWAIMLVLAMLGFMAMRGMSLGVIFYRQVRRALF